MNAPNPAGLARIISTFCIAFLIGTSVAEEPVSPKITLRSLVLLEDELRAAPDAQAKTKTAKRILAVGAPLVAGSMKPSEAESVAESLKSGSEPPEDQRGYVGFWLLRGLAAVKADDDMAGLQAAKVLKALGIPNSDKQAEIDVIAALNAKGWLDVEARVREKKEAAAAEKAAKQRQAAAEKANNEKKARRAKLLETLHAIEQGVRMERNGAQQWREQAAQYASDSDPYYWKEAREQARESDNAADELEQKAQKIKERLERGDY